MNIRELSQLANQEAERICQILLPGGKRVGKQWFCGDVSGAAGDSMIVELEGDKQGQWFDHAASIGGDLLKLLELNRGLKGVVAAANEMRTLLGVKPWSAAADGNHGEPIYDPCKKAWMVRSINQWIHPVAAWAYHDEKGNVLTYVCRVEWMEGTKKKKDVIPQTRGEDGKWHWKRLPKDTLHPIYGLHVLVKTNDGRPLVIVEGEKKVEAARKLFPKCAATCWQGGSSAAAKADWKIVNEWKGPIVIWPDNDDPGLKVAMYLRSRFSKARQVRLPKELPESWDLADPIPEGISVQGLLDAALAPPAQAEPSSAPSAPYVALGMDETGYFFLNRTEGFVLHYTTGMFTELGIFRIAPDEYWESLGYYRDKSNKVDYAAVAKHLMCECQAKGSFDASRIRGRGVYEDEGRIVIHLGDRLYVDGKRTDFIGLKSEFMYPKRPAIRGVNFENPLTATEASELIWLLEKCTWQDRRSAYLVAGFIYCAFLCGILPWRPHLFLTGMSSAGKTWVIGNIIFPILKDFARSFMAVSSSEAGVRQAMLVDALLLILDEFDAEHGHTSDSIAGILGLARQSSSDTGGVGVKGSQDGVAKFYSLKSCFLFCGTAPAITMKADHSRITFSELRKADPSDNTFNFAEIQSLAAATSGNEEWLERFRGRVLNNVRPMLAAVKVFRAVASRILHDTRAGDQNGTLLAGAWMIFNDTAPTVAQAEEFMASMNWVDCIPTESDTDHSKCLKAFLAYRIDFEDNGHNTKETVGRLIERIFDQNASLDAKTTANKGLKQHGIIVDGADVFIANHHRGTTNIFRGTPYIEKWFTHFLRIEGAVSAEMRINGPKWKGILIPYRSFFVA